MVHLYILWSPTHQRRYVGITNNLPRRLQQHNAGKSKSTKPYIPWIILYTESFEDHSEASVREKYFKSAAGRRFLKKIIDQT